MRSLFSENRIRFRPQPQTWFLGEDSRMEHAPFPEPEFQAGREDPDSIDAGPPEIDRTRFWKISRRTRNFTDLQIQSDGLGKYLIIEDEIVRIGKEWHAHQRAPRKGTIAGVKLGYFAAQHQILERRQQPVRDVFVQGHATLPGRAPKNSRAQNNIINTGSDHRGHRRD